MDAKIAALVPEDGRPKSCPRCGKSAKRRATAVERTFRSMSGSHTFRRDSYYDDSHVKGDAHLRGKIDNGRYVAVLGEQAEFQAKLQHALCIEEALKASRVVWVADGGRGNWALASVLAPSATRILDWHHAIEHATDCCKALWGESANDCLELWKETVERLLLDEDAGQLLMQLRQCLALAVTTEV